MSSILRVPKQRLPSDRTRLKLEMDLARRVQLSLIPKVPPSIAGLDLSAFFRPASHVGGDFYDFIVGPDHSLTFFVGDVSGKGIPAAMLMTMTRAILRAETNSSESPTPETILQNANSKLLADFVETGTFVTVFVGQYHPANKELVFANAGHSAVIFRPVNGRSRLLEADGAPLGIQERNLSKDHRLCLSEGDLLVVTTDGLYEARNPHRKSFGVQRLLKHVQRLSTQSALEISNTLLKAVGRFSGCEPQTDDQTILILGCTGQSIH